LNNRLPQRQAGHLTQQYLRNQIYSMSPLQLVIKIYDLAIQGCKMENSNVKKNQFEETQHILHRLRETWIEIEKQTYDPKPNTI